MEIGPLSNGQRIQPSPEEKKQPVTVKPPLSENTDRVEISQDARSKLAEMADLKLKLRKGLELQTTDARAARIEDIRRKVDSGFYDLPQVKDDIANKIMKDLDL